MREALSRLLGHLVWADRRILELLEESAAAPADAVRMFAHLLAAERVWLLRLLGEDASIQPIWPELSLAEMKAMAAANAEALSGLLRRLDDEGLRGGVRYTNSRGVAFDTRRGDVLLHVAMHGSYHRGQVASALRRGGAEPVNTDYITWVRESA